MQSSMPGNVAGMAINPWEYPMSNQMSMSACVPSLPFGKRKIGRLVVFSESKERQKNGLPKFLCVAGPCWPMFLVTTSLIVGISWVILADALPKLNAIWWIFCFVTLINVLSAFFLTGCSDPGIQPRYVDNPNDAIRRRRRNNNIDDDDDLESGASRGGNDDDDDDVHNGGGEDEEILALRPHNIDKDDLIWCEEAKAYRVFGVQYCNETQTLIKDIDHFCPWTGTTIGSGNIKYFYWFLISLFIHMGSTFAAMFAAVGL